MAVLPGVEPHPCGAFGVPNRSRTTTQEQTKDPVLSPGSQGAVCLPSPAVELLVAGAFDK